MSNQHHALQAYKAAARLRSPRDQEADVFRHAISVLRSAKDGRPIERIRALADNRRLWITVLDLMRDPGNALPEKLRASIISVGMALQRDMETESPDFDFLIAVNENIVAGLTSR